MRKKKLCLCTRSAGQWWEGSRMVDGDELGGTGGLSLSDRTLLGLGHRSLPQLRLCLHLNEQKQVQHHHRLLQHQLPH